MCVWLYHSVDNVSAAEDVNSVLLPPGVSLQITLFQLRNMGKGMGKLDGKNDTPPNVAESRSPEN